MCKVVVRVFYETKKKTNLTLLMMSKSFAHPPQPRKCINLNFVTREINPTRCEWWMSFVQHSRYLLFIVWTESIYIMYFAFYIEPEKENSEYYYVNECLSGNN